MILLLWQACRLDLRPMFRPPFLCESPRILLQWSLWSMDPCQVCRLRLSPWSRWRWGRRLPKGQVWISQSYGCAHFRLISGQLSSVLFHLFICLLQIRVRNTWQTDLAHPSKPLLYATHTACGTICGAPGCKIPIFCGVSQTWLPPSRMMQMNIAHTGVEWWRIRRRRWRRQEWRQACIIANRLPCFLPVLLLGNKGFCEQILVQVTLMAALDSHLVAALVLVKLNVIWLAGEASQPLPASGGKVLYAWRSDCGCLLLMPMLVSCRLTRVLLVSHASLYRATGCVGIQNSGTFCHRFRRSMWRLLHCQYMTGGAVVCSYDFYDKNDTFFNVQSKANTHYKSINIGIISRWRKSNVSFPGIGGRLCSPEQSNDTMCRLIIVHLIWCMYMLTGKSLPWIKICS